MGSCLSTDAITNSQNVTSITTADVIQHTLKRKKLLLYGTRGSGKSTIFNSLKYIHDSYTDQELNEWIPSIRLNIINGILRLLQQSQLFYEENLNISLKQAGKLLVYGYIHQQCNLNNINIAMELQNICLKWYYEIYKAQYYIKMTDDNVDAIQLIINYNKSAFIEEINYDEMKELGMYYLNKEVLFHLSKLMYRMLIS